MIQTIILILLIIGAYHVYRVYTKLGTKEEESKKRWTELQNAEQVLQSFKDKTKTMYIKLEVSKIETKIARIKRQIEEENENRT